MSGRFNALTQRANPNGYEQKEGIVIIPRAAEGNGGASSASATRPRIFIDPGDPATGEGGVEVNFSELTVESIKEAHARSEGDVGKALRLMAKSQHAQPQSAVNEIQEINVPAHTIPQLNWPTAEYVAPSASLVGPVGTPGLTGTRGDIGPVAPATVPPKTPAAPASYIKIGMPFLTDPPSRPTVDVSFYLPGGKVKTKAHAVCLRGICLTLVYDTRYDGEQFLPADTGPDEQIRVQIPSQNLDVGVNVIDIHNVIGCLELIQLIVRSDWAEEAAADANPMSAHMDLMGP